VQGRSSASEYYIDFFKLEADELKPVVSARVAGQTDDDGKVTAVTCEIEDDEALAGSGLTAEQAKEQFCAEATVQGLITDMQPTP
jgi:hypothetical protein